MKFAAVLVSALAMASAARLPRQAIPTGAPGVDFGSSFIQQMGAVTRQIQGVQSVLQDLNGQLSRMITTGSRLVSGQQSESTPSSGPNPAEAALQAFSQLTNQLTAAQRVLTDLSSQLNRMIESSTRLVSGQQSESTSSSGPNPAEAALQAFSQLTNQLTAAQRVLTDLSSQLNRMIESSTRLVSGQQSESQSTSGPNPAEAALQAFSQLTNQLTAAQRVLSDLSSQLNRMIQSSTRLVSGQQSETQSTSGPNPAEAALQAFSQLTNQLQSMQRVLSDLSSQVNRMITTGSRLVSGQQSESQSGGGSGGGLNPAEGVFSALSSVTAQFTNVQRVLGELSSQLNQMVATGSRLVTQG